MAAVSIRVRVSVIWRLPGEHGPSAARAEGPRVSFDDCQVLQAPRQRFAAAGTRHDQSSTRALGPVAWKIDGSIVNIIPSRTTVVSPFVRNGGSCTSQPIPWPEPMAEELPVARIHEILPRGMVHLLAGGLAGLERRDARRAAIP